MAGDGSHSIPYAGDSNYPLNKYIAEKRAEVADDDMGIFVAGVLYRKMNGKKDWVLTRVALLNLMCDR